MNRNIEHFFSRIRDIGKCDKCVAAAQLIETNCQYWYATIVLTVETNNYDEDHRLQ